MEKFVKLCRREFPEIEMLLLFEGAKEREEKLRKERKELAVQIVDCLLAITIKNGAMFEMVKRLLVSVRRRKLGGGVVQNKTRSAIPQPQNVGTITR